MVVSAGKAPGRAVSIAGTAALYACEFVPTGGLSPVGGLEASPVPAERSEDRLPSQVRGGLCLCGGPRIVPGPVPDLDVHSVPAPRPALLLGPHPLSLCA